MLACQFGNLSEPVVTLLFTETGETYGRLTTLSVLLGQLHSDLLEDLSVVALKGSEKSATTIDNDEAELLIICQEACKWRGIEPVPAVVQGLIDRSEGLEIVIDLLLSLTVVHKNHTAEDNQTVLRSVFVELKLGTG